MPELAARGRQAGRGARRPAGEAERAVLRRLAAGEIDLAEAAGELGYTRPDSLLAACRYGRLTDVWRGVLADTPKPPEQPHRPEQPLTRRDPEQGRPVPRPTWIGMDNWTRGELSRLGQWVAEQERVHGR